MKRKILTLSTLALVCSISVACNSYATGNVNNTSANNISQENSTSLNNISTNNPDTKITSDKAKEIALNHANLSENEVKFIKSNIDYDDGMKAYDVEFYNNVQEYDYKIDANSGAIIEFDYDVENYTIPQTNVNTNLNTPNNNLNSSNNQIITDAKAKEIALNHAKLSQNQVSYMNAHLDYDDGLQVYDVDFYVNDVEYSYEIDAQNGNIVSYEMDSIYD
mgnify:CR=1 FL=1